MGIYLLHVESIYDGFGWPASTFLSTKGKTQEPVWVSFIFSLSFFISFNFYLCLIPLCYLKTEHHLWNYESLPAIPASAFTTNSHCKYLDSNECNIYLSKRLKMSKLLIHVKTETGLCSRVDTSLSILIYCYRLLLH